ncbi:MAG: glycosyltransferase [Polyangiaceae bacterium]|nr:glycosyltransferase [Polyangiaceae bacterium]
MPVYDDWQSAQVLARELLSKLTPHVGIPRVVFVDDGSQEPFLNPAPGPGEDQVEVLHLRRNVGHQRAIAIGLAHVQATGGYRALVVMDADGEDTVEGALALLQRFDELEGRHTVFGARRRRTENFTFRFSYRAYRVLHALLTGREAREGNFCVLPRHHVDRMAAVSELWNHFAASIFKARLPIDRIFIDRGVRIAGKSKMNFLSLITHGLSAISVFADIVGLRLLIATFFLALVVGLSLLGVILVRLTTGLAVPGWATAATGLLLILLSQAGLLAFVFVFIVLQSRNMASFIPLRDYSFFVERVACHKI